MNGFFLNRFRVVVPFMMLWPTCVLTAAYDPSMHTLQLTRHVSLDEVLDSGLRPRKSSRESFQRLRLAIGSVRLDFGVTSFQFKDFSIGLSFSGAGVLTRIDLQSQGIRDAPTVAAWFENWSQAMGVINPVSEDTLRRLSGYEDIGTITGLRKDYGSYVMAIAPRAVGTDLGNRRRYVVDASVVIYADGKPLDLPIVFALALPTEKYRTLNLEPYSKDELNELQKVINNHNEEWLGIPMESLGELQKQSGPINRGPEAPPAPRLMGDSSSQELTGHSRKLWLVWVLLGLLPVLAGIRRLIKRSV